MRARVVLAALLAACGGPPEPAPRSPASPDPAPAPAATHELREAPPIATPGEHMQYRLSLRGVDLATYDLGVGEITELDGKKAIVVQGHAKTRGLAAFFATIDDHFTSWVDVATGRSLRFATDEYATGSKTDIEHAVIDLARRSGDVIPIEFHINNP